MEISDNVLLCGKGGVAISSSPPLWEGLLAEARQTCGFLQRPSIAGRWLRRQE